MRAASVWVSCWLIVFAVVGPLGPLGSAWADGGRSAAKRAYAEGKRHYDVGEYTEALAAFKRAYLAHEDPVLLFNIAQCQRQLGHTDDALTAYRSYLRKNPDAPNRAEVEEMITRLEPPAAPLGVRGDELRPAGAAPVELAPPAPVTPAPDAALVVAAPPARTPVYKKWWLWTIVGGVVVAGAATGIALGIVRSRGTEPTLPNVVLP